MFNRTESKIAMLNSKHRKDFGYRYYILEKNSLRHRLPLLPNDTDNAYDREAKLQFHKQTICVILYLILLFSNY